MKRRTTKLYIFLFLHTFIYNSLFANDGAAGLSAGEIAFKKIHGISMEREDLYISEKIVRVKYEFFNKTQKEIKTLIAFPISWIDWCGDTNFDTKDKDPMNFTVKVNGKFHKYKFKKNIYPQNNEGSCGETTITLKYYWTQVFKPMKKTIIEHTYSPIFETGIAYMTKFNQKDWEEQFGKPLEKSFCATKAQISWVMKNKYKWKELKYILKTANTWDGPIKHFEIIIDKGARPRVFLCTDIDLKKVKGKNQFRGVVKNFKPKDDISIAFVGNHKE